MGSLRGDLGSFSGDVEIFGSIRGDLGSSGRVPLSDSPFPYTGRRHLARAGCSGVGIL